MLQAGATREYVVIALVVRSRNARGQEKPFGDVFGGQQAGPQADRCAEEGDDDDQRLLPPQNGYELAKVDFVFSNYGGGGSGERAA